VHVLHQACALEPGVPPPLPSDTQTTACILAHRHLHHVTMYMCYYRCSTKYSPLTPNTNICPVCMGEPGSLPVPNQKVTQLQCSIVFQGSTVEAVALLAIVWAGAHVGIAHTSSQGNAAAMLSDWRQTAVVMFTAV
jgi:GatB/GatE catalytic domain